MTLKYAIFNSFEILKYAILNSLTVKHEIWKTRRHT